MQYSGRVKWLIPAMLAFSDVVTGAPIQLSLVQPMRLVSDRDPITLSGTIGNTTGRALETTSIFLNAFAYEPDALSITQLIGRTVFMIPDGAVSAIVPLFEIGLGPAVQPGGNYSAAIFLTDEQGNESNIVSVAVAVTAVPEPGSSWLVMLAGVAAFRRGRSAVLLGFALSVLVATTVYAEAPRFLAGAPDVVVNTGLIRVSIPIQNAGDATATDVVVTSATLGSGVAPTAGTLPVPLGVMAPTSRASVSLTFPASASATGTRPLLSIRGTYQFQTTRFGFTTNRFVDVPSSPGGTTITDEQRIAVLDNVRSKVASLPRPRTSAVTAQLVAYLKSLPEFADVGVSEKEVWTKFKDGRTLIIGHDLQPDPVTTRASGSARSASASAVPAAAAVQDDCVGKVPEAQGSNLPSSNRALLVNTLGNGYRNPVPMISSWLSRHGYQVDESGGSVEELMHNLRGGEYGVLYFQSHTGSGDGNGTFSIWTGTLVSAENEKTFASDLNDGRLEYFIDEAELPEGKRTQKRYSITSKFVSQYWLLSANSFVLLAGCDTAGIRSKDLRQALYDHFASVVAGWCGYVYDGMLAHTSLLVFDRLLGANTYVQSPVTRFQNVQIKEDMPQRAFPFDSIAKDLLHHEAGLDVDESGKTVTFRFLPDPQFPEGFGLLSPSITYMATDEDKSVLWLTGFFGKDPATSHSNPGRKVMVGGTALAVQSWAPNRILAHIPRMPQDGSSGDVTVWVGQHPSNHAALTSWDGPFRYEVKADGDLTQRVDLRLRWRVDVRPLRLEIHEPPVTEDREFFMNRGSTLEYSAAGTGICAGELWTRSMTWTGSGRLAFDVLAREPSFSVSGKILRAGGLQFRVDVVPYDAWGFSASLVLKIAGFPPVVRNYRDSIAADLSSKPVHVPLDPKTFIVPQGKWSAPVYVETACPGDLRTGTLRWPVIWPIAPPRLSDPDSGL